MISTLILNGYVIHPHVNQSSSSNTQVSFLHFLISYIGFYQKDTFLPMLPKGEKRKEKVEKVEKTL
jgi:hypothetical protein